MDTEPVNPFQSPRAEDTPASAELSNPAWRDVLVGLLVAPLARPLVYLPVVGSEFDEFDLALWFMVFTVCSYVIALPAIGIAVWLHRTQRLTPLMALIAWGWVPFVTGVFFELAKTHIPPAPTPTEQYRDALVSGFLMASPVITFALYLAYLRRRDQKRAHEFRA
jgi:hypothetical protein